MLTLKYIITPSPGKQKGVTLMITLIMLVVMTLSAIALIRSTDTTNLIAGNVAFQQGTTNSAQRGIQAGMADLARLNNGIALGSQYSPVNCNQTQTPWWSWWNTINLSQKCTSNNAATFKPALALDPLGNNSDASGNTVYYLIERLCNKSTDTKYDCEAKTGVDTSSTMPYWYPIQLYRITAFVSGPRGTQSLVQAIVSQ